ncbi:hypothetical protein D3C80_1834600 [compost metagenome]
MCNSVLCLLTRDHSGNLTGVYKLNPSTVSVPELIMDDQINIFPNPFSSETTLHTDKALKNATLTIYNCFGETVKQLKNISGQTLTLSRDNFPNGMYFIRLTEENKIYTDKLIITDK